MKISILTLAFSFVAGAAGAQFSPISPRINPLAGLPMILPSPVIGPIGRPNIGLPAPALTPSLILSAPAPAAAPLAAAAVPADAVVAVFPSPFAIPARSIDGRRENVRHPMNAVLPNWTIRLTGRSTADVRRTPAESAQDQQDQEDLNRLFDEGRPSAVPAAQRETVGDSRRIGLPEWDLERELGL